MYLGGLSLPYHLSPTSHFTCHLSYNVITKIVSTFLDKEETESLNLVQGRVEFDDLTYLDRAIDSVIETLNILKHELVLLQKMKVDNLSLTRWHATSPKGVLI